jgi:hypothetical protein
LQLETSRGKWLEGSRQGSQLSKYNNWRSHSTLVAKLCQQGNCQSFVTDGA